MKRHGNRFLFYLLCVLVVCLTAVTGVVLKARIPDNGLASINHVKDLEFRDIRISYAFSRDVEEAFTWESYPGGRENPDYISTSDVIAVVTPTGVIDQSYGSLGQEIIVKKVIKGSDYTRTGRKAFVYGDVGFYLNGENIEYGNVLNLMYPDCDYLIFMDCTPLYEYQTKPSYTLKSFYFGYIKLNAGERLSLKNENYQQYKFPKLKDYEFFSTSDRITAMLNDCMNAITERYNGADTSE